MAEISDMARELGKALGRTEEYQVLKRAISGVDDDRTISELRNRLEKLEGELTTQLQAGNEPDQEKAKEYEETVGQLQGKPEYQKLVAAQENFDKVLRKVNETIAEGIREGADSRIILPS